MPNQQTRYNPACGNDKCGTFAPVPLQPNHGGKPMPNSGLGSPGAVNKATPQMTRGGGGMRPSQSVKDAY